MKYIEVEQKYQIDNPDPLKQKLTDLGAKTGPATRQIDTYFNAPHRDFLAPRVVSEWLRIRESEHGASVNFKRWLPADAEVKTHCDEYESPVADAEAVRRTLESLDFPELVTVDKGREEWTLDDVVIAFDTVKGAGSFVEFEFKGDAETVEDAITRLDTFITSLDVQLGERVNRGYPHMLIGREH